MNSTGYYLTALVIKLKGLKKTFSRSPIDYARLRKDDQHSPSRKHTLGQAFESMQLSNTTLTRITPGEVSNSQVAILYCPGGAFVYGPTRINWHGIAKLSRQTRLNAYLLDYPKAPEHQIETINRSIDEAYAYMLSLNEARNIILIGDSVGATLLTLLVQRLLREPGRELPNSLILVSPVADASMSNPAIAAVDPHDIILSTQGVVSAKQMCAGRMDLRSPEISPLYGRFEGFVPAQVFIAERDIMRPDAELLVDRLSAAGAPVRVVRGAGMPHIWPFLPVMSEAQQALNVIADYITARVAELVSRADRA